MATKEKNPCKILHPNQNQLQEKLKSNGSKNQFPKGSAKSNAETPKTVYGKQKMRSNEESQDSKPNPPTSRSSGSRSGSSTQSIKQKQPHTGDKMASKQKIPCKIVNSVQCQVQEQLKGNGSKNQFPKNSAKSNTETPNTVLGKQKMRSNEELQDSKSNHLSPMSSGSRSGSLIQSLKQKQPRSGDEMASKQKNLCKILNPHQSQVEEKLNGSMNHFPENSAKSNTVTPKTVLGKQKMRSNEELQNSKPNLLTPISSGSSLVSFSKLKSDCSKNQFPKNSAKSDTEKPKTVFGKQKVRLNEELQASKPYPLTPISFDSRSDYSIQSFNQKQPQSGDEMASKQKNPSKIINPHQSQLQEKLKNNCSKNQFPKNSATSNTETQKTVLAKQKVSSTEELQASKLKPLTPISSDYRSGLSIQSFKQKKPRSGNELVSKQKKTSEILHSNKSQLKEKLKSNGSQNQFPKNSAKSDTEKPKTVLGKQKVRLIKELQASKFNPLTPISSDSRSSSSIQSFKQKQPSSGDEMASNQKTPSKILNLNQGRLQEKLKSNGPKNDFPNNSTKSNTEMPKTVLGEQKVRSNEELQASELNPLTPISSDCSLTDALAMDCEMVGICSGGKKSALGRVTLVNTWGNVVYDEYSRPMEHVVDYRTAISGIQPCDLIKAKDFYIVRKQVAKMINHKILVGHALHHDLKALLLNHPKRDIRDTSKYAPYLKEGRSCSLKKLAAQFLGVEIQNGQHCPVEDARAVMLLYQKNRKQWESSTKDVMGLEAKTKKRKQRKTFKDTARGI